MKFNFGEGSGFTTGTAHGVNLNDSPTFGAKVTAWYLPRQYKWQPQIGLELDYTKFTADLHPQTAGASGTSLTPGFELGSFTFGFVRDVSVDTLAANLPFRHPIWSTPDLPQGRIAPYVGIGVGAQRATLSVQINGHREVSYAPAGQLLTGVKLFVTNNLAVFGEYKRVWSSHEFTYSSDIKPPGYKETWSLATNVLVGGVALHF